MIRPRLLTILCYGAGILDMVLSPVVSVLNPERRSAAMNWLHSFYCVGAVVTILASTVALQVGLGWRHASLLLVPLPLALLVVFGFLHFPELVHQSEQAGRSPMTQLLSLGYKLYVLSCSPGGPKLLT
jgi:MFS family permease